jgi:hypothetical protein
VSNLEKQQEKIAELLKLISENPGLEILPMVDSEIGGDDFSRYSAEWGKAEIDHYYCSDERIYFKSCDFEELVDDFINNNCDNEEYRNISDEDLEKIAESNVESYEWVKAIIVNIDPY